ncbi:hypothetical protein FA95DRAFT_1601803 [Auriscalpium vulgare]|uniref:Uncharacterized protein n=1 Tax=Auriscalpium vulgare TaxID=40419 RepID=A0ACB8S8I3_9AGAM|nr:hypothetical protein FA95DRAFT_1601803 [Auriscalpium vulgare]
MGINWHDPLLVQEDFLAFIKFLHCIDGLYIWEYVTTLNYEWEVITGKRPYRWTIWIYSISRLSALWTVILNLIGFNLTHEINCQVWIIFELFFAYLAFATASLLIVLRVAAIWNRNMYVMGLALAVWLTNIGFLIHGIVTVRDVWVPESNACLTLDTDQGRNNICVTLATDLILCLLMLIGLVRAKQGQGVAGIWRVLYRQGLVWLVVATIAEVPPAVFAILNLNDPWNLMFQTSSLITMEICATRMYRSLTDFGRSGISDNSSNGIASAGAGTRLARGAGTKGASVIPMSRMEVSVHTTYEDFSPEGGDKPRRLSAEESSLDLRGKQ